MVLLKAGLTDILQQMSPYVRLLDLQPAEKLASNLILQLKRGEDEKAKDLLLIINTIVVQQTKHNINLLYSLLYRRENLLTGLEQRPGLKHYFINIGELLEFISG